MGSNISVSLNVKTMGMKSRIGEDGNDNNKSCEFRWFQWIEYDSSIRVLWVNSLLVSFISESNLWVSWNEQYLKDEKLSSPENATADTTAFHWFDWLKPLHLFYSCSVIVIMNLILLISKSMVVIKIPAQYELPSRVIWIYVHCLHLSGVFTRLYSIYKCKSRIIWFKSKLF